MIPEESFLRRIPLAYETQGRMELEAIAFAIDAIYLKHQQISKWATNCDLGSFVNTPHHERLDLFLNLWSIVDQADVLRRLLQKIKTNRAVNGFLNIADSAQRMRNKMDHLSQNIPNIASKTGKVVPVYGVLSFGKFGLSNNGVDVEDFEIYTITAGSLTHKSHQWPIATPSPGKILEIPVGMFEFSAFDSTLDVSGLVQSLHHVVQTFETDVRPRIEAKIKSVAEENGLSADALISECAGSIATVIRGQFRDS